MITVKKLALAAAMIGLGASTSAFAADVALSSDGASFVSGTSFINLGGYSQSIAEANLLTNTPSAAYFNGDTRYIFGGGSDTTQAIEINLGSVYDLSSFAATFGATDRTPTGLSVSVSTDGTTFTPITASFATNAAGSEYTVTPTVPIDARYVTYTFGAPSGQYGGAGSGISQLFANAVPEPATWAMMLLGFGAIGLGLRTRRSATAVVS